jgi:hypothetical protein
MTGATGEVPELRRVIVPSVVGTSRCTERAASGLDATDPISVFVGPDKT